MPDNTNTVDCIILIYLGPSLPPCSLSLVVGIACLSFPSASALSPFPASGQLAYPGHPGILDGAWIAQNGAPDPVSQLSASPLGPPPIAP